MERGQIGIFQNRAIRSIAYPRARVLSVSLAVVRSSILQDRFGVDGDLNQIADDNATPV
jgi:hypothetical protein